MQRDINITIKIESIGSFAVRTGIDEEIYARKAQKLVNDIFNSWKEKFPQLEPQELMGRIAFMLARRYEEAQARLEAIDKEMESCENQLDELLLAMEKPE